MTPPKKAIGYTTEDSPIDASSHMMEKIPAEASNHLKGGSPIEATNHGDTIPMEKTNTTEETSDTDTIPREETNDMDAIPKEETSDTDTVSTEETNPAEETKDTDVIPREETNNTDAISTEETNDIDGVPMRETSDTDAIPTEGTNDMDAIPTEGTSDMDAILTEGTSDTDAIPTEEANDTDAISTDEASDTDAISTDEANDTKEIKDTKQTHKTAKVVMDASTWTGSCCAEAATQTEYDFLASTMRKLKTGAQRESSKEKRIYEEFKSRVLWALLTRDEDTYLQLVNLTDTEDPRQKLRVQRLLFSRQQFRLPGKGLPRLQRPRDRDRLLGLFRPLDLGTEVTHDLTPQDPVESLMLRYRGYLLHLLAVLDRKTMLGKTVAVVYEHYGVHRTQRMLMARDSERNTPLDVSLSGNCRQTMASILYILRDTARYEGWCCSLARNVLRKAFIHDAARLYINLDRNKMVPLLLYFCNSYYDFREVSLFWTIFSGQMDYLRYLVREEGRSLMDPVTGLPLLHWAVMFFSFSYVNFNRREILEYLAHNCDLRPEHRPVSPNQTCSVNFKGIKMFGGTAVHFALYTQLQPVRYEEGASGDIEIDAVLGGTYGPTHRPSGGGQHHPQPQLALQGHPNHLIPNDPDQGLFQVLEFLYVHGADFSQPDEFGKTPLDILPADADPDLVDLVLAFQTPCSPASRCHAF